MKWYKAVNLADAVSYGKFDLTGFKKKTFFGKVIQLIKDFIHSVQATDFFGICAQSAFILLVTILPTLLFIIIICNSIFPDFDVFFLDMLNGLIPGASYEYISDEIKSILTYITNYRIVIIVLSTLFGTITSHAVLTGINQTYGFKKYEKKGWEWFKSFLILILITVIIAVLAGLFFLFTYTERYLEHFSYYEQAKSILSTLQIFLGFGLFFILTGLYAFVPQRHIRILQAVPGAVFSTLAIVIVFRFYIMIINHSANYLIVYGSYAGVFLLLVAFYFLSVIICLGVKLNLIVASLASIKS